MEDFRDLSEDPPQLFFATPGLSPAFSPWSSRNASPFVPTDGSDSDLESQVSDVPDANKREMYFNPIVTADDATTKDGTGEFEGSLSQDKREELDRGDIENSLKSDAYGDTNESDDANGLNDERKPFVRGHRRVRSYPPQIIITRSAFDSLSCENLQVMKSVDRIVRSKSDTDVSVFTNETKAKVEACTV